MSKTAPTRCPVCGANDLRQDEDVLDTWFSSWLWPFSTLGWPKKTKDLEYFYPTDTLVTAQEIIFFWVARMIMAGYFCMKQPPFTKVYIHGTVRDITGKKMSKSLGNIIDPLDIIKQYGTDALRYTLITATAIGQDVFLSEERFVAGRNFANKLWNATRYALSAAQSLGMSAGGSDTKISLSVADRWILSRLQWTITSVTASLEHFLFNEAATTTYDFLWHDVCDWYLEISKHGSAGERAQTIHVLVRVLETSLRLLHPIMPFVTEELWQHLRPSADASDESIMLAAWPKANSKQVDGEAEELFERFKAVIGAIRNTKAELNVPLDSRPPVRLMSAKPVVRKFFEAHRPLVQVLAGTGDVHVEATRQRIKHAAATVVDGIEVVIPLEGIIDPVKERQRLTQRVEELTSHLSRLDARLKDPQFASKAPADVVEQTKQQRAQTQETLKKFSEHLAVLQSM